MVTVSTYYIIRTKSIHAGRSYSEPLIACFGLRLNEISVSVLPLFGWNLNRDICIYFVTELLSSWLELEIATVVEIHISCVSYPEMTNAQKHHFSCQ